MLALPAQSVLAVVNWSRPKALPRPAAWVEGVLAGEGEAVPVLREGYCWGTPVGSAEIYVLVTWEGRSLALAGADPRMVTPRPLMPALMPAGKDFEGPWRGTIDDSGGTIQCLDLGKLYMALGLH